MYWNRSGVALCLPTKGFISICLSRYNFYGMCKNAHLRITVVAHTTLHVLCSESKSKYWINSYLKRFLISRVIRLKWKLLPNSLLCRRIKEILIWPLYGQHFLKIPKCWAMWVWPLTISILRFLKATKPEQGVEA